jgi:hypothetical protein
VKKFSGRGPCFEPPGPRNSASGAHDALDLVVAVTLGAFELPALGGGVRGVEDREPGRARFGGGSPR